MTMPWIEATIILFGGLMLIMAFGLPVAFAFLAINLVGAALFLGGENGLVQFNRNAVQSVTAFALTPIPFFVLMGEVLFHSGVAMKAIDAFALLIRRVPGRLSVIAIVAGTVFSAISGSTIATTALLGSLMLPTMLARGYHPKMAMGPIMGIGGVDMLIPPSALTVLLGSLAGISISGLLIGGIVPGLMLSALFIGYIIVCAHHQSGARAGRSAGGQACVLGALAAVPALCAAAALDLRSRGRRDVGGLGDADRSRGPGRRRHHHRGDLLSRADLRNLMKSLLGTVAISGIILFIIVGATTFSQVLSFSGVVNGIIGLITGQGLSPMTVLIGMILILLLLGCFVDQVSMMLITLPFFMPLVAKFNIDPIWFGMIFLICMQLGLLTPPFGLLLYTMKGVAPPSITMNQIYVAALPYVLFGLLVLLLIILFSADRDLAAQRARRMTTRTAKSSDLHLDDLLPYLMNRLMARMNQNLADDLRKRGFTFQDWRVLAVLAAHEGANLTELAEATVIPQPSVSRLAANLAKRGYVARENGKTRFAQRASVHHPEGPRRLRQDAAARGCRISRGDEGLQRRRNTTICAARCCA